MPRWTRLDLAIIDDEGYITAVDRKKDMIKTGGENVASRGVEEALYWLPGVSEVALGGLSHPRWIEAVTAIVVCKPGQVLTETQVNRPLPQIAPKKPDQDLRKLAPVIPDSSGIHHQAPRGSCIPGQAYAIQ